MNFNNLFVYLGSIWNMNRINYNLNQINTFHAWCKIQSVLDETSWTVQILCISENPHRKSSIFFVPCKLSKNVQIPINNMRVFFVWTFLLKKSSMVTIAAWVRSWSDGHIVMQVCPIALKRVAEFFSFFFFAFFCAQWKIPFMPMKGLRLEKFVQTCTGKKKNVRGSEHNNPPTSP